MKLRFDRILMMVLAMPTALSVISKLDKRLNFGEYLERIVLSFSSVSKLFWERASDFIPVVKSIDHLYLSFLVLLVSTSIVPAILGAYGVNLVKDEGKANWRKTSMISIIIFILIFGLIPDIILSLGSALMVFSIAPSLLMHTYDDGSQEANRLLLISMVLFVLSSLIISMTLYFTIGEFSYTSVNQHFSHGGLIFAIGFFLTIAAFILINKHNSAGPTLVLALVITILGTDYLDQKIRPVIENFLSEAEGLDRM